MADFSKWSDSKLKVHYQRIGRLVNGPYGAGGRSDIVADMESIEAILKDRGAW